MNVSIQGKPLLKGIAAVVIGYSVLATVIGGLVDGLAFLTIPISALLSISLIFLWFSLYLATKTSKIYWGKPRITSINWSIHLGFLGMLGFLWVPHGFTFAYDYVVYSRATIEKVEVTRLDGKDPLDQSASQPNATDDTNRQQSSNREVSVVPPLDHNTKNNSRIDETSLRKADEAQNEASARDSESKDTSVGKPSGDSAEYLLARAKKAFEAGEYEKALLLCKNFLRLRPQSTEGKNLKSRIEATMEVLNRQNR